MIWQLILKRKLIYYYIIQNGTVYGAYKVGGDYVTYEQLDEAFGGNGRTASDGLLGFLNAIRASFDDAYISAEEVAAAHELGIYPPSGECHCSDDGNQAYVYKNVYLDGAYRTLIVDGDEYYYETKAWPWSKPERHYVEYEPSPDEQKEMIIKEPDPNCQKFLKYVIKNLKKTSDSNFDTYTPYIENVQNHWFRDVYFVNDGSTDFVDYDYQYELITGERWTLYQTYTSDPNDEQNVYNPEREGEFVYYELDEATGDYIYEDAAKTKPKIYEGNVVSGESSIGYDGELLKDEDGNPIVERLAARGEDGTLVIKKAVTLNLKDTYEDLGWHKSGSRYMAYDPNVGDPIASYEQMYSAEEIAECTDDMEQSARTNMYVEIKITQVNQTGEGLRTETNNKIKKMFLSDYYFKYDGSQSRAEIIYALREKLKNDSRYSYSGYGAINVDEDGNQLSKDKINQMLEQTYDLDFSKDKFTSTAENGTYKVGDYVSNVSFQQDAMNTFTMMENSHTLDTDYIYRDFKELVVELGYFEKEELTEGKPKLLQWIVPIIGSAGYPNRSIDKRDEEYGTMVHSKADININEKQTILALISGMGSELPSDLSGTTTASTTPGAGLAPEDLLGGSRISIDEVGAVNKATKTPAQVPLSEFLDTTRKMCEEINQAGYDYCVYNLPTLRGSTTGCKNCASSCVSAGLHSESGCSCTQNHCKHDIHHNSCVLKTNYEASKPAGSNNLCCATLVSWALQNVGVLPESLHEDGAEELATKIVKNLDPEKIEKDQPLQEGDILCYEGHIDIVGKKKGSGFEKYNGGHQIKINATEFGEQSCIEEISGWPSNAQYALRLNWGQGEPGVYVGYEGNEAVVSPVTGILREYGEYDAESAQENRENLDLKYGGLLEGHSFMEEITTDPETGEEIKTIKYPYDKVGYAVIEILDAETYRKLETEVANRWNPKTGGTSLVKINEKSTDTNAEDSQDVNKHVSFVEKTEELLDEDRDWTKMEETVYAYKEFTERYEQFGIGGYYVYIDGFKCETVGEIDEEEAASGNTSKQPKSPKITTPGDPLTFDSFKISEADVYNENYEPETDNLFEADKISKLISESMYNKLKAESGIKCDASTGITFKHLDDDVDDEGNKIQVENEYVLIKEGTVLGRTYTDEEIINERDGEYGTYEEYLEYHKQFYETTPASATGSTTTPPTTDENTEDEELSSINIPLMGNYLRIIMQATDGSIVENVEDYMKLDEVEPKNNNDWELFYWLPFESGGTDKPGGGPECQGTCSTGETAVGIVQWTVLDGRYHDHDMNNITAEFIPGCIEEEPTLCAPLSSYSTWTTQQFWNDWNDGTKQFQQTLKDICSADRDTFLHCQMEVAKKQYLQPIIDKHPWVESRPSCVQGAIMHLKVWGAGQITDLLNNYESATDEEIMLKVRDIIDTTGSTAAPAPNNGGTKGRGWTEPEIGLAILDGRMGLEDVEEWVRTKDTSVLIRCGVEYRGG